MTSATEELRALLDARGVKHGGSKSVVYFEDSRRYKACAYDAPKSCGTGFLCVTHTATPAQAVEATLGRRTCHVAREPDSDRLWHCDACGAYHEHASEYAWEYCPRCGRKVVDE